MSVDTASELDCATSRSYQPSETTPLVELVLAAKEGRADAWDLLVRRYTPLVDSIAYRYRLSHSDAQDMGQMVWLRLFEHLGRLREVEALPGWITTTAKNEALRSINRNVRVRPVDHVILASMDRQNADDDMDHGLLREERSRMVLDALAELAPSHRNLLILLHVEPQPSYEQISKMLGMPVGSIGPTRSRCLQKLRRTSAMRKFMQSAGHRDEPIHD